MQVCKTHFLSGLLAVCYDPVLMNAKSLVHPLGNLSPSLPARRELPEKEAQGGRKSWVQKKDRGQAPLEPGLESWGPWNQVVEFRLWFQGWRSKEVSCIGVQYHHP